MTIRVGTTEADPTHHIKLRDRAGTSVGLILCNDKGEPAPIYNKNPIERTALKTQSGGGSYSDFDYPYAPIVQDDWSGGRGNRDFERDSTRYFDGYRVNTRHENKVLLGPQEHFSKGYKSLAISPSMEERYRMWGAVSGFFVLSASITVTRIWLFARYTGTTPTNFSIEIHDATDDIVASGTFSQDYRVDYKVGSWIHIDIAATLAAESHTIVSADATDWEFEYSITGYTGDTPQTPRIKYILEATTVDDSVIYFEYKGQQYKVLSPAGGTPTVWMNGDRGVADSNSGFLTLVIDATKTWTVDEHIGRVVKIIQGTGKTEKVLYRTIVDNTATELVCDTAYTITQDNTTEYVILGSDTWQQVTGHGLTVPVTDVLVVGEVVYFAQGDSVLIRSHRAYNNAGTWTSEWRAEGIATNFAEFLEYEPLSGKIWRAQNKDATGIVSVSSTTNSIAYGTDLVFQAVIPVADKYSFINGIEIYPAENGTVALWVYKEELAYVVTTQAEGIKLPEMRAMRSRRNGSSSLVHNVYSYFTLGNGLQRYYGGNLDSVGPNIDDGLPPERSGPIINLMGYPGRIMAIVDGGDEGYSSLMERSGSGWHEVYRAPYGERLKGMALQVIPGTTADRLWLYQGNISIWLPIAGEGVDETLDPAYTYAFEGAIIISRMHAGMFDIQKLIKILKVWSDGLEAIDAATSTDPPLGTHQYLQINLDYRLDEDTAWTALTGNLITSPVSSIDLSSVYGIAGKRIQLRVRMQSGDRTRTPKLLAVIVEAVLRVQVKYMYNLTFRVMDDEPSLTPREMDDMSVTAAGQSAITKLAQIESWADADTDSLLYMTSNSPLYNGKYVFINPPTTRQIATDPDTTRQWTGNGFVCSTTVQEA